MGTTIQIDKKVREELRNRGKKNQTYSEIINDLLRNSKKSSSNSDKLDEKMVM